MIDYTVPSRLSQVPLFILFYLQDGSTRVGPHGIWDYFSSQSDETNAMYHNPFSRTPIESPQDVFGAKMIGRMFGCAREDCEHIAAMAAMVVCGKRDNVSRRRYYRWSP